MLINKINQTLDIQWDQ